MTSDRALFIFTLVVASFLGVVTGHYLYLFLDMRINCVEWELQEVEVNTCLSMEATGVCLKSEKRNAFEMVCTRKKGWSE